MANFLDVGLTAVVGSGLALWATAHLAQRLGASTFGVLNLARTVMEYGILAVTLGFTVVGMRDIAREPSRTAVIAHRVTITRLAVASVAAAAMVLASALVQSSSLGLGIRVLTIPVIAAAATMDWVYTARENVRIPAVAGLLGRVLYVVLVVLLVNTAADLPVAVWALAAEAVLVALLVWLGLRGLKSEWRDVARWQSLRDLLHAARPIGVAQLFRQIKTNVDVFILALIAGTASVGYYTAAYRLVVFASMLAGLLATVLLPRYSRDSHDGALWARHVDRTMRSSSLLSVAIVGGGVVLARPVILFLFGPSYEPAASVMLILVPCMALIVVSALFTNMVIGAGRERAVARAAAVAAALNVVANLALVPAWGMHGAAIATLMTEAYLVWALARSLWDRGLRESMRGGWFVRLVLAGVLQGVVTFFVARSGAHVLVASLASVCTLFLAAHMMRVLDVTEVWALLRGAED